MKTSDKLLLLFVLVYVIGLVLSDNVLKNEYAKIKEDDPYKNYQALNTGAFKALSISGGNGYSIKIKQGKDYDMKVMNSRRGHLEYSMEGDTLNIRFKVPKIDVKDVKQQSLPVGLIITSPVLSSISLSGTYSLIDSLHSDSLAVTSNDNSTILFSNNSIDKLVLTAKQNSHIEFSAGNQATNLFIELAGNCLLRLNDTRFVTFRPILKDKAEIVLSRYSINQMKISN